MIYICVCVPGSDHGPGQTDQKPRLHWAGLGFDFEA